MKKFYFSQKRVQKEILKGNRRILDTELKSVQAYSLIFNGSWDSMDGTWAIIYPEGKVADIKKVQYCIAQLYKIIFRRQNVNIWSKTTLAFLLVCL